MGAAFITCIPPRSMGPAAAVAWLERRAQVLRLAPQVDDVTVRELRPRQRDPVWLIHVLLGSDGSRDWNSLLGQLVRDLRRLGMQPTVCIDERSRETAPGHAELQPAV